jgi:hypothetical protein
MITAFKNLDQKDYDDLLKIVKNLKNADARAKGS